jgi:hypothetical protein
MEGYCSEEKPEQKEKTAVTGQASNLCAAVRGSGLAGAVLRCSCWCWTSLLGRGMVGPLGIAHGSLR